MDAQDTLLRHRFDSDSHRPRYHFLPPTNWMNDPNGVIHWKGKYHLFYQYNPFSPLWGNMHWGHAVSENLIHWRDLPIALAPTPGGPDEAGCFSGCAIDNGLPTIVYTGTRGQHNEVQTQCLATSTDDLLTWEKYVGNPVLAAVPEEAAQKRDFRDPFVWKEDDGWYMALGSQIAGVGGAIFLYRSPDLIDWTYLHPLLVDARQDDSIWECPNFFRLGDYWVLIVSTYTRVGGNTVAYFVGAFENHQFTPITRGIVDDGVLYAPLSMLDDQERRILFGWVREARPESEMVKAGWSGVQSIPRVLTLDDRQRLHMTPVPELTQIRGVHHHFEALDLSQDVRLDVSGLALDIEAEFQPQPDGRCGISLLCSADATERTDIVYEAAKRQLVIRTQAIGADGTMRADAREVPHELAPEEPLTLRILLDGSVIETIANERTSVTSRVYPSRANSNGMYLFGTKARLNVLDIWEMPSIWD